MSNNFTFRQANLFDIPQLIQWTKSLMKHEALDGSIELPLNQNLDLHLQSWLESLITSSNALLIVSLDEDNQYAGCILGLIQEVPNEFLRINLHGVIQMIWVEPDKRRSGLAKNLVNDIEKLFLEMDIKYSEIGYSQSNVEAQKFWQKMNYTPVSITSRKILSKID